MISLDVENYCQECEKFEPECMKMYSNGAACLTLVSCTNKGVCANLAQHIRQQIESINKKEMKNEVHCGN